VFVPELATAAAIGKRAPTVVGGKVIVLGPQDHPASLPSGRPRPPQVPSPPLRARRHRRSRWPIFAFTMTDLAFRDGLIFAFTMVRNSHPAIYWSAQSFGGQIFGQL
jgi:hypothetical protein